MESVEKMGNVWFMPADLSAESSAEAIAEVWLADPLKNITIIPCGMIFAKLGDMPDGIDMLLPISYDREWSMGYRLSVSTMRVAEFDGPLNQFFPEEEIGAAFP